MKTIQLKVEDDFYEEFLQMLPKDKVTVISKAFLEHQSKLHKAFKELQSSPEKFSPYFENMNEINTWIAKEYE